MATKGGSCSETITSTGRCGWHVGECDQVAAGHDGDAGAEELVRQRQRVRAVDLLDECVKQVAEWSDDPFEPPGRPDSDLKAMRTVILAKTQNPKQVQKSLQRNCRQHFSTKAAAIPE